MPVAKACTSHMRTFTLSTIARIQDFQFLTDSSGFVLDGAEHLHRFVGNTSELVATPPGFAISHFHFVSPSYGAIVGNAVPDPLAPQKGSLGGVGLVATLLLLLIAICQRRWVALRGRAWLLIGLTGAGAAEACSPAWHTYRRADANSTATTLLTRTRLGPGGYHYYLPNKKQKAFIAITHNQGQTWDTQQIPTSFFTSALSAIGNNFLVGTYANEQEGQLPLHGDGDIWLYGTDATYTKQLALNTPQQPFSLRVHRGIVGFAQAADSLLLVFGSDRMPTFPANELSATPGNIYALPLALGPHAKLIDVPDTVDVRSLAAAATGELWATLANHKPHVAQGKLFYVPLPTKRLLRFGRGQWQAVALPQASSFEQVAFVPGTHAGYLLTEAGELLETRTDGQDWHQTELATIRKIHPYHQAISLLRGDNQLVMRPI
jgi:hypothetical protein